MPVTTVYVDGDITTGWDTAVPGGTHFSTIDEGISGASDADYIETTTLTDVDEFTVGASPANTDEVTQIDYKLRAKLDDSGGTVRIKAELFHTTGTPVTGNPKYFVGADFGGYGTLGNATKSWTALTLTKAQADSLQARITFETP